LIDPPSIDPWDARSVIDAINRLERKGDLATDAEILCDITGGTKPMSIGLWRIAERLQARVIYVDSEGADARSWQYRVGPQYQNGIELDPSSPQPLPAMLQIDDLFRAYLGHLPVENERKEDKAQPGYWFARDVVDGFRELKGGSRIDEIRTSVYITGQEEIDIVLRKRNRFAVVECKWMKNINDNPEMKGIHQLNNAASDRYLGVYTGKILALRGSCKGDMAEIAEGHDIQLLLLPEWENRGESGFTWTKEQLERFKTVVDAAIGRSQEML
jgi:hypothetical protein